MEQLTATIQQTNQYFRNKVQKQVNTSLTLRNWVIGYYIVEYEQSGKDRAQYGLGLFKAIAKSLVLKGVKSLQERNLYLCRDFYRAYPQILQTVSANSYLVDFQYSEILQTVSAKSTDSHFSTDLNQLLTNLSFSHFIELFISVLILIKHIQLVMIKFFEILFFSLLKQLIYGHSFKNGYA